ncbi:hypothetical protein [Halorientalis salina]|uniref:hypothetical protein n=1 Tax=Halorientalis salina TaxID=2932266 RepID=UPI0010ACF28D|nr:hypothetical protein [Halorientalis salina]
MASGPAFETMAEHRRVFDQIWTQLPEQQNRTSSSWWFFILFPDGEEGYGPRQLMFSIAARVGDELSVNDVPVQGMDLDRPTDDGVDEFGAVSVGWDGDDEGVDEHVVRQPAEATLSDEGFIEAWAESDDGTRRGSEIRASENRPLGLDAHFVGEKGEARFEAWGDLDCQISSPHHSLNIDTVAGGIDIVAWRRMDFEGEFDLPKGRETLTGKCYFQRVCLNMPLHPWKWVWAIFPDGTAFSVMIPFLGPQLLRRGYRFLPSNVLERATVPVRQNGLWDWGTSEPAVDFDTASVTPILHSDTHPEFEVRARNDQGDFVEFVASPYGHARNHIDRPVLGDRLESHWSYNEYLIRMRDLEGRIGDTAVSSETMGQAFGTLEYSWGMGL